MQYARLPFPSATATLLPYTCHCGATHLKLCATDDIPDNAVLLIGEAAQWKGCLVQFDGSAHKRTQVGGAGVSLLQVTQDSTTLVRWKSIPLLNCPDNAIAEAHACLNAVHLATEFYHECLKQGVAQDGVVIQGDILPLLNYLQGRGRIKRLEVVKILEECQQLLARAPFIFRLVYLPRECNKLADHFAGIASAAARKASEYPLQVASAVALFREYCFLPSFPSSSWRYATGLALRARYVDNVFFLGPSHMLRTDSFQAIAQPFFYGRPLEMEYVADETLLGFALSTSQRTITFRQPPHLTLIRSNRTAGSPEMALAGFFTRGILICRLTRPRNLILPQLADLTQQYLDKDFTMVQLLPLLHQLCHRFHLPRRDLHAQLRFLSFS